MSRQLSQFYLLYLESGILPDPHQPQGMKPNFHKYIISQEVDSIFYQIFDGERNFPIKGDCTSGNM